MKNFRVFPMLLVFCCFLSLFQLSLPSATAQVAALTAPVVRKIDPPNWWANYTPDLTLLLSGDNLTGARVKSTTKGVIPLGAEPSANGHYLFVHLQISSGAPAKTVSLQLTTPAGSTTIQLPLLARTDSRGHFEGFSRDDVIYLIMPDRFADGDPSNNQPPGSTGVYDRAKPMAYHGGDLRGIREHLGYLRDLGVTTLWLTPIWKNTDSDYHGYHAVDFYALDGHMGSMQEYQALVADAHKLGMKVLIDYVVNHTGPHHPWADDPPTPTWLHGTPAHHPEPSYNFSGLVDPHASPREYLNTLDGWFAGKLPDLNPDDPELAIYLAQNAMWWTEIAQLDGFRLDTFPYSTRQFWSGWHDRLRQVYPKINDVGEVADPDSTVTSFFEGGRKQFDGIDSGLATVFDFPLESALRDVDHQGRSHAEDCRRSSARRTLRASRDAGHFHWQSRPPAICERGGQQPGQAESGVFRFCSRCAEYRKSTRAMRLPCLAATIPTTAAIFPEAFPAIRKTPSPSLAVPPNNKTSSRTCSRCLRCETAIPPCVPENIGISDGMTITTPSCASCRKRSCWSSTATRQKRANSIFL